MNDIIGNVVKANATKKLYYEEPYLTECSAYVVKVTDKGIQLDRTIAFPEGGGQESDRGILIDSDGNQIPFVDSQKGPGRLVHLDDFPTISVDTPIYHVIENGIKHNLNVGDVVTVKIDFCRRERLSLSHSASHLLFIAVGRVRPDAPQNVKGCHITEDYARFDFSVTAKFTAEEIEKIKQIANELSATDAAIKVYPHSQEKEAWYWEAMGEVIPCGGTHVKRTGLIGKMEVRRKTMGKGKERITVVFPEAVLDFSSYYPN